MWYIHKDGFLKHVPTKTLASMVYLSFFLTNPDYQVGARENPSTFLALNGLWKAND